MMSIQVAESIGYSSKKKLFVAFLMSFTTLITKWTGILHVKGRINLIGVLEKHETTVETSSEDLKSP